MEQIVKELLTWGILIYNKNTIRDKRMYRIKRSKNNAIRQLIKKKIDIIKTHYLQTPEGGKYRVRDVVAFAHLTKDSHFQYNYHPLHTKLL